LADKLAHSPGEGIFVRASLSSLPASTAILLFAAAKHLSHLLGYAPSPEFGGSELSSVLGKPEKTVSGRLSELVQKGFLKRVGRGGYAITSLGLTSLAESSGAG
jgi:DNA-binding transcriptional ArsR family regulator